jgi:hypothetical protein
LPLTEEVSAGVKTMANAGKCHAYTLALREVHKTAEGIERELNLTPDDALR